MFGIGETELVIIVVFAFLLFGPDKLPGMGRTLGRMLRQFREASDGFTEVVQTNIMDPAADELKKSPKQRRREEEEAMSANTMEGDAVEAAPEVAPRRETFAERKARLAAERRAREDAGTLEPQTFEDDEVAPGADSDEDVEDATPRRVSAKDLYAMSPTKAPDTESVTADVAETDATDEGAAKTEGRDGGDRI